MRVIHVDTLVAESRDIAGQQQRVLRIDGARDEIEFGDEGVLDPIGKPFGAPNDAAHLYVRPHHRLVHPLRDVEDQDQTEEQRELEALADIAGGDFEQIGLVVLFEHRRFDFGKVPRYQQRQQGLIRRIHCNVQRGNVDEQQAAVERRVHQDDRDRNRHPPTARPSRRVPVQAVEAILSHGAHQSIEHLHDGNEDVQLDHALPSDPVIQFADTYRHQHVLVHRIDDANLYELVDMPSMKMEWTFMDRLPIQQSPEHVIDEQ
mmetsp:Transcript_24492/g.68745  ORF Transcript_24492/g.68745 Transcript_24492/m.68745 type:complete len:261 (-) Transcript_24492:1113-1895(-)